MVQPLLWLITLPHTSQHTPGAAQDLAPNIQIQPHYLLVMGTVLLLDELSANQ
jgi:hypothetical protein